MKATRVCSVTGCNRKHNALGLCVVHRARMKRRGTTELFTSPSVADRLTSRLLRKPNGCLEWTGSTNEAGYGRISIDGKTLRVHRLAWELANGPIPEGIVVCHTCDRPPCCDVTHLFLGTQIENIADMDIKERRGIRRKVQPFKVWQPEANSAIMQT